MDDVTTEEALLRYVRGREGDVCATLIVAKYDRWISPIETAVRYRQGIINELARSHRWRDFYLQNKIDPLATFAIPDEEIAALQHRSMQSIVDEIKRFKGLL